MRLAIFLVLATVIWAGSAWAQTPTPVPEGFWPEFFSAAKAAGWFGTLVMTLMWWLERGERLKLQNILHGDGNNPGALTKFVTTVDNLAHSVEAQTEVMKAK